MAVGSALAQDTLKRYLNENLMATEKKGAVFQALVTRKADHYIATVLYDKGNVMMRASYKDKSLYTRDGEFSIYNEDGTAILTTEYLENRINGYFRRWNKTGTIADSGMVRSNRCFGEWRGYHPNGNLQYKITYSGSGYSLPDLPMDLAITRFTNLANTNNQQLFAVPDGIYVEWHDNGQVKDSCEFDKGRKTGKWKSWYNDGTLESEGSYLNDLNTGVWQWFHSNGNIATHEMYREGKLADLSCYDSTGKATGFTCALLTRPHPTADSVEGSFEDYLMANLYYPPAAMNQRIEGSVNLEFLINKEGKLKSINIINSPNPLLSEEVIRMIKSVRQWAPAISHNRRIDYLYELSVPFRLP